MIETDTAQEPVQTRLPTATSEGASLAVRVSGLPQEQVDVLKATLCAKFTEPQMLLYLAICKRKNADPFTEAYGFPGSDGGLSFGLRIDGMRSAAYRTGQFTSRIVETLFDKDPSKGIIGARATVQRQGMSLPVVEEAYLQEYDTGKFLWATHKETMIRKVAEAKALRAAFADALSGVYEPSEIRAEE